MAVVIETTLGDITVDLYLEQRPVTCLNFLKLCKMKYYNYNLFHSIRSGFIAQTGDPSGEGSGGQSIWGILEGPDKRFFSGEKMPKIRHTDVGLLSMVCTDDMMVGSQFFFTLAPDLDSLDGKHCVIGEVTEGHEVLTKLNEVICDETHRPYRDVRVTHTVVLEDPFNDPPGLRAPSRSPSPNPERLKGGRIAPDEEIDETHGKSAEEIQEMIEEKEAKARATILEIVGDLPDAEIAPPENVLFVCKLNPVTTDEDLEIIFSRFGKIVSCEVIRDKKTGNSLQYAFIEFDNKKPCEDAYFKMDNVLIDDRRIHVDFSQSVSKMRYLGKGRGVQYFDDDHQVPKSKDVKGREEEKLYHRKEDNSSRNRNKNMDRSRDRDHKYERERDKDSNNRNRNSRSQLEYSQSRPSERDHDKYSKDDKREKRTLERHRDRHSDDNVGERDRPSERDQNRYSNNNSNNRDRSSNNFREREHRPSERHQDRYTKEIKEKDERSSERYNDSNNKYNHKNNYVDSKKSSHSRKDEQINKKTSENNTRSNKERCDIKRRHENDDYNMYKKSRLQHDENNQNNGKDSKTPSPTLTKKLDKGSKKKSKHAHNNKKMHDKSKGKKRKQSTSSSDSDSSSSSSSSESSSSSSGNDKKKKSKRKKRKYSTSSSSSSESSSSSSSSSSESSDSSTSSDEKHSRKKSKKPLRKPNRKIKKKL